MFCVIHDKLKSFSHTFVPVHPHHIHTSLTRHWGSSGTGRDCCPGCDQDCSSHRSTETGSGGLDLNITHTHTHVQLYKTVLTVSNGLMPKTVTKSLYSEAQPTTGVSGAQVTLAAGSLGKVMEPAWVQTGQLCSTVGTILGPQRGRWGHKSEMVNDRYTTTGHSNGLLLVPLWIKH